VLAQLRAEWEAKQSRAAQRAGGGIKDWDDHVAAAGSPNSCECLEELGKQ